MKICEVDGCSRGVRARGLCRPHYEAWRKANPTKVHPRATRDGECYASGCERPIQARGLCTTHYARASIHGDLDDRTKSCESCGDAFPTHGRQRWCFTCAPPGDAQARMRLRRYGISAPTYAAMVGRQKGLCAICRIRPATDIDHDHRTGAVRGLLCAGCNMRLHAIDNAEWFDAASAYVKGGG